MAYLDMVIGFSLVMLLFASGVSVAQTMLKRVLAIKGRALHAPLLDEIEHAWKQSPTLVNAGDRAWNDLRAHLSSSLSSAGKMLGAQLRTVAISDARSVIMLLRGAGREMLDEQLHVAWQNALAHVESRWDTIAVRLMNSYETHTRRWVLALSLVAVMAFNVDAIRMIQVLSVNGGVRDKLAAVVETQDAAVAFQARLDAQKTLTGWQKFNAAELAGTGVPIGWSKAALIVCEGTKQGLVWGQDKCDGGAAKDWGATAILWLVRLLGLLVAAGLVAQGAPFWYSVLDTVLGIKKRKSLDRPNTTAAAVLSAAGAVEESIDKAADKVAAGAPTTA